MPAGVTMGLWDKQDIVALFEKAETVNDVVKGRVLMSYVTEDIFVLTPPKQTLKAWEPLWDCISILFEFQNSDVDEERTEWKLYWIAGIALLRTIGHVLIKSDALISAKHKTEIGRLWAEWKADRQQNSIFWNFIENERNNVLKTYTIGAHLVKDEQGYYVAYMDDDDAFHLFRQAVYWSRHQLMELETRL